MTDTTGFALDPEDLRSTAVELAAAARQGQEAVRELVAGLRALAAALPASRAAPVAEALAAAWEADGARWVAGVLALGEALAATATSATDADATLARGVR
ncbi:hypothetical protein [Actinomycetospora sp. TBRC 11914]|uniref:hypothetical protein n=1 Tax=Actinomycetospora sp. TBRC 11914 TaxID=2729387 RepID=UPI00145DE5E9|nr:hypothetical protein [Actinomycetospora sp. TBRC 11914]NMO90191.1 hypothetical protein [Actinomycetospora sp. TBRC 11914]